MNTLPTHDELIQRGARLAVDRINHREFVQNGTRYYCGWSSVQDTKRTQTDIDGKTIPAVIGWITYEEETEEYPF